MTGNALALSLPLKNVHIIGLWLGIMLFRNNLKASDLNVLQKLFNATFSRKPLAVYYLILKTSTFGILWCHIKNFLRNMY